MPPELPKVLISYSHDSPEHSRRVRALCDRLRADGIESGSGVHAIRGGVTISPGHY